MGGQRVVLLEIAERRLRAAQRMRRHRGPLAPRIDADLGGRLAHASSLPSVTQPGVVDPRRGPWPLGIATELPATGVALGHDSVSSASIAGALHGSAGAAAAI